MNRADKIRAWAPGAPDDLVAMLADRPLAEVEATVRFLKAARLHTIAQEDAKRRARREGRRRDDETERTAGVLRIIQSTAKRAEDSPEALAGLAAFARAVNLVMGLAVDGLRRRGYSDQLIAECLGVTQQAVSKRWKRRDDLPDEPACWSWPPAAGCQTIDDLKAWQLGRCALCGLMSDLESDHDHATGLVRGLVCSSCNTLETASGAPPVVALYRQRPPAVLLDVRIPYVKGAATTRVVTP